MKEPQYLCFSDEYRITQNTSGFILQQYVENEYVTDKHSKEKKKSSKWIDVAYQRNAYLLLKKIQDSVELVNGDSISSYVSRMETIYKKLESFIKEYKEVLDGK